MDNERKIRIENAGQALLAMQRHSWEQGVAMQAFYEVGDMKTVKRLAVEAVYRSAEDGRVAILDGETAQTDPCSAGEALMAVAKSTQDPSLLAGIEQLRHWALVASQRSSDGIVYHFIGSHEYWSDSMYMLPPFLSAMGHIPEAIYQMNGYWEALYDKEANLLCHQWDESTKTWSDPAHWGVGNGWCMMGLVRMIDHIKKHGGYEQELMKLQEKFLQLLEGVLKWERDGHFHNIIDDETTFIDVSQGAMYAYAIYRALKLDFIGKEQQHRYHEAAKRICRAVEAQQDEEGFIHSACGAPHFDKSGMSPETQAAFMMMEAVCL